MTVCPECKEPSGPGLSPVVWGYAYAEDEAGERVEGSEQTIGMFHPECWERWKERHPQPDDDLPDEVSND